MEDGFDDRPRDLQPASVVLGLEGWLDPATGIVPESPPAAPLAPESRALRAAVASGHGNRLRIVHCVYRNDARCSEHPGEIRVSLHLAACVEFVAVEGGAIYLKNPAGAIETFRYGSAGAGVAWGAKLPKLGKIELR